MREPKETLTSATTDKGRREAGNTAASSAMRSGADESKLEFCHGSVCLGNQKPTNCICPTTKK